VVCNELIRQFVLIFGSSAGFVNALVNLMTHSIVPFHHST
jgi:hypothetical protein